jgi:hypothetical protein
VPSNAIITYPGSLHYFIGKLLLSLGVYGNCIWGGFGFIFVSLLVILSLANFYLPAPAPDRTTKFLCSPLFFSFLIAIGILVLRSPNLILFEQNPDEGQWMASAATLLQDPRFWVSVNAGPNGPLNIFPLTLIKFFGGTINYATVRLFGLLFCLIPAVLLLYASFRNFFDDKIARVIILPLAVCIAFARYRDIIAYNSEHLPLLLVSLSIFFFSKIFSAAKKRLFYYSLLGLTLGCMPYSKMQVMPLVLVMLFFCGLEIFFENRNKPKGFIKEIVFFAAAVLVPTIVVLAYVLLSGIIFDFWQSYIVFNFAYTKTALSGLKLSWPEKFYVMYKFIFILPDTKLYFAALFFSGFLAMGILFKARRPVSRVSRKLIILSSLILAAAVYSIIVSDNFFPHYQLLFIIPVIFFSGSLIGILYTAYPYNRGGRGARSRSYLYVSVFMVIGVILPGFLSVSRGNATIKFLPRYGIAGVKSMVAEKIKAYARPNEKMAVWGWMNGYYILANLTQGTKDPHVKLQVEKSTQQAYFLKRYAADLLANKPVIFLDAITPYSFYLNEPSQHYENFPLIKKIVDKDYTLAAEVEGKRIYVRSDRYNQIKHLPGNSSLILQK